MVLEHSFRTSRSNDLLRDLDLTFLPILMRKAIPPTHALCTSAILASIVDPNLLKPPLPSPSTTRLRLDDFHSRLCSSSLPFFLLSSPLVPMCLSSDPLFEAETLEPLSFEVNELRVWYPVVCGEEGAVECLGGVFSIELSRFGGGEEDLWCGRGVHWKIVDGLV
jgi:hypothetical protein